MAYRLGTFDALTPAAALEAVERVHDVDLDGTVQPYPSYVNRVYGVRTDEGREYVAKFYRPGRWSTEAIAEEHEFLADCAAHEIPVVSPMPDPDGDTLAVLELETQTGPLEVPFALFEKRGGRNFDPESDEQWFRLGSIVGRVHLAGLKRDAPHRPVCEPTAWTAPFVNELLAEGVLHPDLSQEFRSVTESTVSLIAPLFEDVPMQRIHGDCHRGNLLDRPDEGLLIIDFDDMMTGPAVQDLWLLLPGHAEDCGRELSMLLDGYETFRDFPRTTLELIEPLRFMRMVHFLAWQARQRDDHWFRHEYPEWGTKQFWIREVEDLRTQAEIVRAGLS